MFSAFMLTFTIKQHKHTVMKNLNKNCMMKIMEHITFKSMFPALPTVEKNILNIQFQKQFSRLFSTGRTE